MASNSIVDFKWMSKGGLLLDSSGDIAFTDTSLESIQDMVVTRVQADLNAWKLYAIGADLQSVIGESIQSEVEITIQKQITQALTNQFLPLGSFVVTTIPIANSVSVYIYIQGSLVASTVLNLS